MPWTLGHLYRAGWWQCLVQLRSGLPRYWRALREGTPGSILKLRFLWPYSIVVPCHSACRATTVTHCARSERAVTRAARRTPSHAMWRRISVYVLSIGLVPHAQSVPLATVAPNAPRQVRRVMHHALFAVRSASLACSLPFTVSRQPIWLGCLFQDLCTHCWRDYGLKRHRVDGLVEIQDMACGNSALAWLVHHLGCIQLTSLLLLNSAGLDTTCRLVWRSLRAQQSSMEAMMTMTMLSPMIPCSPPRHRKVVRSPCSSTLRWRSSSNNNRAQSIGTQAETTILIHAAKHHPPPGTTHP